MDIIRVGRATDKMPCGICLYMLLGLILLVSVFILLWDDKIFKSNKIDLTDIYAPPPTHKIYEVVFLS